MIGVTSAAEALGLTGSLGPPDVAVVDLDMPDIDGFEFIDRLRLRWLDIPVVIVTGRRVTAAEIDETGGAVVVAKPFTGSALRAAVDEALLAKPGAPV